MGRDRFLPPATKLGQGYIFTGVCDSVHRGGAWWRPPGTVTAAGGTYPTGMHSCWIEGLLSRSQSLCVNGLSYCLRQTIAITKATSLIRESLTIQFWIHTDRWQTQNVTFAIKNSKRRQDCIPVGCVPSVTVAVCFGGGGSPHTPLEQAPPHHPPVADPLWRRHPLEQAPPGTRHPPRPSTPLGPGNPPEQTPLPGPCTPPCGQRHACKHITLPQTSFAGGREREHERESESEVDSKCVLRKFNLLFTLFRCTYAQKIFAFALNFVNGS